ELLQTLGGDLLARTVSPPWEVASHLRALPVGRGERQALLVEFYCPEERGAGEQEALAFLLPLWGNDAPPRVQRLGLSTTLIGRSACDFISALRDVQASLHAQREATGATERERAEEGLAAGRRRVDHALQEIRPLLGPLEAHFRDLAPDELVLSSHS